MLRSATHSTEHANEPKLETGSIPSPTTYQPGESFTSSSAAGEIKSRATAETAMIAREIREGTLSGFVGSGTAVTGQIAFKFLLRIDGLLSGHVTSAEGTLIVGASGRVDANVAVAVARIHGTVTGDILCTERAELGPAARVTGSIYAPTLVIDRGAVFDGSCRMKTPAAEPQALAATAPEAAAEQPVTVMLDEPVVAAQPRPVAAKARKIARKGNVLGTKPKRTRTRAAKSEAPAQADGESAVAAAG